MKAVIIAIVKTEVHGDLQTHSVVLTVESASPQAFEEVAVVLDTLPNFCPSVESTRLAVVSH